MIHKRLDAVDRAFVELMAFWTVLLFLVQVTLVVLKLVCVIDWPWLHVVMPTIALFVATVFAGITLALTSVLLTIIFGGGNEL